MRFLIPAVALAAIATPVAVAAQSGDARVTVRINTADVNLATDEGRAIVERRIESQITEACTIETNSRYGYGRDLVDEACVADARAAAFAAVERIAANERRSGGQVAAN